MRLDYISSHLILNPSVHLEKLKSIKSKIVMYVKKVYHLKGHGNSRDSPTP